MEVPASYAERNFGENLYSYTAAYVGYWRRSQQPTSAETDGGENESEITTQNDIEQLNEIEE